MLRTRRCTPSQTLGVAAAFCSFSLRSHLFVLERKAASFVGPDGTLAAMTDVQTAAALAYPSMSLQWSSSGGMQQLHHTSSSGATAFQ